MIKTLLKSRITHLVLLAGLVLGLLLMFMLRQDDHRSPSLDNLLSTTVESYDGQKWQLSKFKGRALLVNFWASWCAPCMKELPALSVVSQKYQNSVFFVGLAVGSPAADVADLVSKYGILYPIAKVRFTDLEEWGPFGLPSSFLFDAQGKLVWSQQGPVSEGDLEAALAKVLK